MQYQVSRAVAGPFLKALGRPKITGTEHVPATGDHEGTLAVPHDGLEAERLQHPTESTERRSRN